MLAIGCEPYACQSIGIGTLAQRKLIIGFNRHRDPKLPGQCIGNGLNGSQPTTFKGNRRGITPNNHLGPHPIVIPMQVIGAKSPIAVHLQISLFKQTVNGV